MRRATSLAELFANTLVLVADTSWVRGYDATYGFVARSLAVVRAEIGPAAPVHMAVGVRARTDQESLAGFAQAIADNGAVGGWSIDDFWRATPAAWQALAALEEPAG